MYNEENSISDEEISEIIALLVQEGALEILGYDSVSDQITYKISEKCKEIYPELYYSHFEHIGELAMSLWQDNVIDIIFTKGQTIVGITEEQSEYIKDNLNNFDDDKRLFLESILPYYSDKE
jgi:hypothetical protein